MQRTFLHTQLQCFQNRFDVNLGKYYVKATAYDPSIEYFTKDIAVEETSTPEGLATLFKATFVSIVDTEKFYQIQTYQNTIPRRYGSLMLANVNQASDFSSSFFKVVDENGADAERGQLVLLENPNNVEFIFTFKFGEKLRYLLKDQLVNVTATPYIRSPSMCAAAK